VTTTERAATRLPLLETRKRAFENCGYCPKLCRAACPVSNAEPRETITPWGKMSVSWLVERGDLPRDEAHGIVPWACTGCFACRERCDHRNPLVPTLFEARREALRFGVAPAGAKGTVARHERRMAELERGLSELVREPGVRRSARTALLIGCGYVRKVPDVARHVVRAAVKAAGEVRLIDGCCGAPLLHAGDEQGFLAAQQRLARRVRGAAFVAADAGCTLVSAALGALSLSELLSRERARLGRISDANSGPVRWHDPCGLGRGLGRYEAPRRVLEALLGRPPDEFVRRRAAAACSGGGALLPLVLPDNSAQIAADRLSEHESLGGGTIVTACAASLRRLSSRAARVVDLATLVAERKAHG
jgi:Fe-S oxidoreductase